MQDEMIVALYWKRDESAISETERKYGRYLSKIAYNILSDWEDSKETVNDTYLKAWNSMPTHTPCRRLHYWRDASGHEAHAALSSNLPDRRGRFGRYCQAPPDRSRRRPIRYNKLRKFKKG